MQSRRLRSARGALVLAAAAVTTAGLAMAGGVAPALAAPATAGSASHATPRVTTHMTTTMSARAYTAKMEKFWTPSRMRAARDGDQVQVGNAAVRSIMAAAHPAGPAVRKPGAVAPRAGTLHRAPAVPDAAGFVSTWGGNQGIPPATTTGKVFFSDHLGGGWVCSAEAVNTNGKDAIFTAGHCVFGIAIAGMPAGETWHSNWLFVPDFNNWSEPFGAWGVTELVTLTAYANNNFDFSNDMGVAIAATDGSGNHLVNVVGGQGFEWNFGQSEYIFDFGYPVAVASGLVLQECDGTEFVGQDIGGTSGLPCNFTGGSSGGPWLDGFNGEFGWQDGINSFTDGNFPGEIFSPYFSSNNAGTLFNAVVNL